MSNRHQDSLNESTASSSNLAGASIPPPTNTEEILSSIKKYPSQEREILRSLRRALIDHAGFTTERIEELAGVAPKKVSLVEEAPSKPRTDGEVARINACTLEFAAAQLTASQISEAIRKVAEPSTAEKFLDYLAKGKVTLAQIRNFLDQLCQGGDPESDLPQGQVKALRTWLARTLLTADEVVIKRATKVISLTDYLELSKRMISMPDGVGRCGGKMTGALLGFKIASQVCSGTDARFPISPLDSYYLTQDVFEAIIEANELKHLHRYRFEDPATIGRYESEVDEAFRSITFPDEIETQLRKYIATLDDTPIVVRSSSFLEDGARAPFIGKYKSKVCLLRGTPEEKLAQLKSEIGEVYASVFSAKAITYREKMGLLNAEENMAIGLTRMVGTKVGNYFLPCFAGVGYSFNDYPLDENEEPSDGLLRLVAGLGIAAVDLHTGNSPRYVSLSRPTANVAGADIGLKLRMCQQRIFAVDMTSGDLVSDLALSDLLTGSYPNLFSELASSIDINDGALRMGIRGAGASSVITFDGMVNNRGFTGQMKAILAKMREVYGGEVDIEFASDGESLTILQARDLLTYPDVKTVNIPAHVRQEDIVFTIKRMVPTAEVYNISEIVYVRPEIYSSPSSYNNWAKVVRVLSALNGKLSPRGYLLLGPGRWGTGKSDAKLGIPIDTHQFDNARGLAEIIDPQAGHYHVPSQGSHFAGALREYEILPLTIFRQDSGVIFNNDFLINSENELPRLVPEAGEFADLIRVVRPSCDRRFHLSMSRKAKFGIVYIDEFKAQ